MAKSPLLRQSLRQSPPRCTQLDWSREGKSPDSNASTLTLPSTSSPIYVPPLPEDRGADDWTNTHDGRRGEWRSTDYQGWFFEPTVTESQSDVDDDATVFKTPQESYKEPTESADEEPYKEPRESTIVQYVTTTTTGQRHKLRPRKARLVADGSSIDVPKTKSKATRPPKTEDSDDQSPDDLSFNGYQVRKRVKGEVWKPSLANRIDARRRQPPGYSPSRPQVLSDIPSPDNNLRFSAHQFRYLIGTRHHDDDEGGDWETMRVVQEGDNVVVYRRQVIGNGTKLSRSEDGPIWALDVAHMTLAYKRRGRANTATWTDSDSEGYRKRSAE